MAELVGTIIVGDLIARIELDPEPPNPREWDNLGTMVCLHQRHSLGDPHHYRAEGHSGWADLEAHILRDHAHAVLVPIYMMDHSGLVLSTSDAVFSALDPAAWDWGRVGLVYASVESIRAEYGVRRVTRRLRELVERVLVAEVDAYSLYLAGEAYAFTIEDAGGRLVSSCGGLLGYDRAVEEARLAAEAMV